MSVSSSDPRRQSSGDLLLDRRFAYAAALREEGDHIGAADLLRQIIDRAPHWIAAWMALADAAERSGDTAEAVRAYGEAAVRDADGLHGAGAHHARVRGNRTEPVLPARYIAALFDDYAARFERHLVEGLGYSGPAVLVAALKAAGAAEQFAHGVDLGCGTGLMGRALAGAVRRLDGVDLSPAMVAEAALTGLYDSLSVGDIVAHMATLPAGVLDLVVAADVFVYCGPLDRVIAGAAAALAPGGLLAFTVQKGDAPVRLGDDMRFSHSAAHVAGALAASGLAMLRLDEVATRREAGRPVPGLVAVARKP